MNYTIVIVTRNRPDKITHCLNTIECLRSIEKPGVLIIDQSDDNQTYHAVKNYKSVRYLKGEKGKARGLNFAIQKNAADILCFIDDDVYVDKNWLWNINKAFSSNPEIAGVFGRVLPFAHIEKKGMICPLSFENKEKKLLTKPAYHAKNIGVGCNMVFKKSVFRKYGGFKTWLGPGTIGKSAEDAEFALRLLLNKKRLLYEPNILVYHDRWLSTEQAKIRQREYLLGEIICYTFFALKKNKFAYRVIMYNWKKLFNKLMPKTYLIKNLRKLKIGIGDFLLDSSVLIKGLILGLFFYLREGEG